MRRFVCLFALFLVSASAAFSDELLNEGFNNVGALPEQVGGPQQQRPTRLNGWFQGNTVCFSAQSGPLTLTSLPTF